MSWNKPSSDSQSAARKAPKASPSLVRGVVAGLVVAVLGIAAFFVFNGKSAKPKVEKSVKKPAQIEEVKPAANTNTVVEKLAENKGWQPPKGAYKDEKGNWRHPGGAMVYDPTKCKPAVSLRDPDERVLPFHHRSEKEIARLLMLEPGRPLFGSRRYDARFEQDFMESLKEPIVISETDSNEDKELKRLVKETKIEITDRMRAGESLKDILEGTRNEFQRLAQYKRNLTKELAGQINSGALSESDLDDLVSAVNQMLKDKGLDPVKNTKFLKRNLKLNNQRKAK